jgi:hypothetical protein
MGQCRGPGVGGSGYLGIQNTDREAKEDDADAVDIWTPAEPCLNRFQHSPDIDDLGKLTPREALAGAELPRAHAVSGEDDGPRPSIAS